MAFIFLKKKLPSFSFCSNLFNLRTEINAQSVLEFFWCDIAVGLVCFLLLSEPHVVNRVIPVALFSASSNSKWKPARAIKSAHIRLRVKYMATDSERKQCGNDGLVRTMTDKVIQFDLSVSFF